MNGVHDMGGMQGFGPVVREENEPVFHAPWEGRLYGMRQAVGPVANRLGGFRWAIEQLDPKFYLNSTYYERWLEAFIDLLEAKGLVTEEEIAARSDEFAKDPQKPVPVVEDSSKADAVMKRILRLQLIRKDNSAVARFVPGDVVRVRNLQPKGHTRQPRYLRGKTGVVAYSNGVYDVHDHLKSDEPLPPAEHLYSVRFDMYEIWGEGAEPGELQADLWERYLEPAS